MKGEHLIGIESVRKLFKGWKSKVSIASDDHGWSFVDMSHPDNLLNQEGLDLRKLNNCKIQNLLD